MEVLNVKEGVGNVPQGAPGRPGGDGLAAPAPDVGLPSTGHHAGDGRLERSGGNLDGGADDKDHDSGRFLREGVQGCLVHEAVLSGLVGSSGVDSVPKALLGAVRLPK